MHTRKHLFVLVAVLLFALVFIPSSSTANSATSSTIASSAGAVINIQQESEAPELSFARFNLEAYWYSRFTLSRAHARSGFGVHMLQSPIFKGNLEQLQGRVKNFAETTGHFIPVRPWPVFLEFKSGMPFFVQEPDQTDFGTLRWNPATFDRTLVAGALGQAAVKKIVWTEQFLRAIYDPPENRFIGFVLSGEVISTFQWLRMYGTNTGKPLDLENYDGEYFVHALEPILEPRQNTDGNPLPPAPVGAKILNADSVLSDQWALLWATTELLSLTRNEETAQYYNGDPYPANVQDLAMGLTHAIFENIQSRHWNSQYGTLIDRNIGGVRMGQGGTTAEVSLAVNGLANLYKSLHGSAESERAAQMIESQAEFLLRLQSANGAFANSFRLANGLDSVHGQTTLETQGSAITALMLAAEITDNPEFRTAAYHGYDWLLETLWDSDHGLYQSAPGQYHYSPNEIAAVLSSHRNLLLDGDDLAAYRMISFWDNVVNNSGMLQAELPNTGEAIGDDNPDTNENGIPEPGSASAFADAPFGVDAVLAGEVRLNPANGHWSIADRIFETEPQMYAANEMYLTGVPNFAPDMVQALELRSITPENKFSLSGFAEARQAHREVINSLPPLRQRDGDWGRRAGQLEQQPDASLFESLEGAVVTDDGVVAFFTHENKVCFVRHAIDVFDEAFEVGCLDVPEAGERNVLNLTE